MSDKDKKAKKVASEAAIQQWVVDQTAQVDITSDGAIQEKKS